MPAQNYANHAHRPVLWALAGLLAVVAAVILIIVAVRQPSIRSAAVALLSVAVVLTLGVVRRFALRLQDRIIRLEMQMRLARLGLTDAARAVTFRQTVALRFAADGELPTLLARAAAEQMTPDQIKRAVADWQADELRT